MPTVCIVRGCKSVHWKGTKQHFHHLPADEELRGKWIEISGATKKRKSGCICSRHFESTAYERNLKYELLGLPLPRSCKRFKPGAVPTLHLQNIEADKSEAGNMADFDIKEEDIEIKEEAVEVKQENPETEESGSTARRGEKRVLSPSHSPETKKQRTEVEQVWIKDEENYYSNTTRSELTIEVREDTSFFLEELLEEPLESQAAVQGPSVEDPVKIPAVVPGPSVSGIKRKPSRTRRALYDDVAYATYDQEKGHEDVSKINERKAYLAKLQIEDMLIRFEESKIKCEIAKRKLDILNKL